MQRNVIETVVAGVVLVVAAAFLVFVVDQTQPARIDGYALWGYFDNAPTLRPGADVRIAGVTVGKVTGVALDLQRYEVKVDMLVRSDIRLATDTRAIIDFDGMLGDGIVVLEPGQAAEQLEAGARIRDTLSPVNVVDQMGRFIYGDSDNGTAVDDF